MIKISTPLTSANLGPGFDSLGLALDLYNNFYIEKSDRFIIEGCDIKYQNEDNLFIKTYKDIFKDLNKEIIPIHVIFETNIPISRGLGSSASLIVAAIFSANEMLNRILSEDEIIYYATKYEGHPDNVVPAIKGNLCASFINDNDVICTSFNIHSSLNFIALIPNFELSTSKSRSVLPNTISYKDAIYNISRIAPLIKAFSDGDINLLKASIKDKLHEPYRKSLIKNYDHISNLIKDKYPLYISGAGPTLMFISDNLDLDDILNNIDKEYEYKILKVCNKGTSVSYE